MLSKGKWGLAVFVFPSPGHLVTNPSGPGPPSPGLNTAGALCGQGARPPRGRSPGSALAARPREAALSKCARLGAGRVGLAPLCEAPDPPNVPGASLPEGAAGPEEGRGTLSEEGTSSTGRRRPGRASGRESVCPRGPRQRPLAPRSPGLRAAPSRDRQGAGEPTGTLDNGARAGRLAWGRAPGAGVASPAAGPRSAPRGAGPPVSQLAGSS